MRNKFHLTFSGLALFSAGLAWIAPQSVLAAQPNQSSSAPPPVVPAFAMRAPMQLRPLSDSNDPGALVAAPLQLTLLNEVLEAPLLEATLAQAKVAAMPVASPTGSDAPAVMATTEDTMPGILSVPQTVAATSSGAASPPGPSVDAPVDAPTAPPGPPAAAQANSSVPVTSAPADPSMTPPATDSSNAWKTSYINLINILVQRGVLTKKDSGTLVTQAEQNASSAQAQATAALASPAPPAHADDTMRVDYVPETVKDQIRNEVKDDVLQQARAENWAAPNTVPDWVQRYHVAGDLRVRYEGDFFPPGNDDSGVFHNFNAINTGSPFDNGVNSVAANPPTYDVNQDRNRFRLRARIGAGIDLGDDFTVGLRIGTGQDDNPVTENQTIGLANGGQGGDFSKYAIWLDRGFLRYEKGGTDAWDFKATVGRMDNPFFSTSMIWANDIGFDGIAFQGKYKVAKGVTPFLTAGGFPVFNTDLNFATTSAAKFSSEDKYLLAVQGGTDWQITKDISLKAAAAFYYFENIAGKVSDPFTPQFSSDSGSTDDSRPSFAQNGNTYIALRDIVPDASNNFGTINQFQYFGLATPFHEVALTGQVDFSQLDPFHIAVIAEMVKNVAFNANAIENAGPSQEPGPVNNLSDGSTGTFGGGDMGYNVRLELGRPKLEQFGQWNINLTYRYVESDAVVDGFTDADFGGPLVGTNLKGYIIAADFALSPRVWTSLQWMSADVIAGPTYRNDLIQLDINAKF
jgi:hypothetical protein